ncbi:BREX-2 system phosphatase PglZ [Streptomyces solisilvae]|uniref:BREX-2 system phosphatase PglZ n=1 Tax=Streptomyces malaysiensis TaxID=92644 RepID=UPI00369EFB8C
MTTVVPELGQRVVAGLIAAYYEDDKYARTGRRLVLVHGRYAEGGKDHFSVPVGASRERRGVRVAHATSVLGITDAWHSHQRGDHKGDLLVVTTDVADELVGLDVQGEMLTSQIVTVDKADIAKQLFRAADIDPRMREKPWKWLPDALIAAQPEDGWPQRGAVLTLDAAMRALIGQRLELEGVADGGASVDMDALLAWAGTSGAPERFAALPEEEREGIAEWLEQSAGEAAPLLLRLAGGGQGADAMALGVLASVLSGEAPPPDATLALGALFGKVRFSLPELRAYTRAVEGTLTRWIGEAASPQGERARRRVLDVVERADALAGSAGLTDALADSSFLPSGFRARLHRLAGALEEGPQAAQETLKQVEDHHLAAVFHLDEVRTASMAVRLARWLDEPVPSVSSVDQAVHAHIAEWGWVDRAVARLRGPRPDPLVTRAYEALCRATSRRRDELDEAFATELRTWVRYARNQADGSGGALLVEDVLERIAEPLTKNRLPVIIVVSGMSGAVAAELGEKLTEAGRWNELAASGGRRSAAVATVPSITAGSRLALIAGELPEAVPQDGRSAERAEKDAFAAFWSRHELQGALFHPGDVPGPSGQPLDAPLVAALAADSETVVGVVLEAVEDRLAHAEPSDPVDWSAEAVPYLPELLNAARGQGRPVVLVSGSGHVRDRGVAVTAAERVESARWRTGPTAGEGEVELAGPRVLENGGRVTAAWREEVHYTPRKAGYQGGAALAEMAVPVLVLTPNVELIPSGWAVLPPEKAEPSWWRPRAAEAAVPKGTRPVQRRPEEAAPEPDPQDAAPPSGEGETDAPTVQDSTEAAPPTLGNRVVGTKIYERQLRFVRAKPHRKAVAAVIDALDQAGGKLSLAAVVAAVTASGGRAPRQPEGLVTVLTRLLNVEGYDVIGMTDARTRVQLSRAQLLEQFELSGGDA